MQKKAVKSTLLDFASDASFKTPDFHIVFEK